MAHDILEDLEGDDGDRAEDDEHKLEAVACLARPLLLNDLEEDDIEQRPGGDPLHQRDPHTLGVILAGGGVEHRQTCDKLL